MKYVSPEKCKGKEVKLIKESNYEDYLVITFTDETYTSFFFEEMHNGGILVADTPISDSCSLVKKEFGLISEKQYERIKTKEREDRENYERALYLRLKDKFGDK